MLVQIRTPFDWFFFLSRWQIVQYFICSNPLHCFVIFPSLKLLISFDVQLVYTRTLYHPTLLQLSGPILPWDDSANKEFSKQYLYELYWDYVKTQHSDKEK